MELPPGASFDPDPQGDLRAGDSNNVDMPRPL